MLDLGYTVGALFAGTATFALAAPQTATRGALAVERRLAGLYLKKQEIDGFEMPYLEGGTGEPLLLIHGFGGDKDNFTRLARHLTGRFRVVIPDLPGFGDAGRDPSARYGIDEQVGRVRALVKALGLDPLRVGGNSMGGFIATVYAASFPGKVTHLWLLGPAGTAAASDTPLMTHYRQTGDHPLLLRQARGAAARLIGATMARPPYFPGFMKKTLVRRGVKDYPLHKNILADFLANTPLLEERMDELPTPALIVWGTEDRILSPAGLQAMRKLCRRARSFSWKGLATCRCSRRLRQQRRTFWIGSPCPQPDPVA